MSMMEWARREVELACERENPNRKEGEWDYGCACYESALKAFESLMEYGHSGLSISLTKNILNRLIDGKCLTPIDDTDNIWKYCFNRDDGTEVYQCIRMTSFFKDIKPNAGIKYNDNNRHIGVNLNSNTRYHSGLVDNIGAELFPITMPYIPEDKPYEFYCDDLLTDPKNGDYDTVGIYYCITPNGDRVNVNRFFKDSDNGMVEIDFKEYMERKRIHKKRLRSN